MSKISPERNASGSELRAAAIVRATADAAQRWCNADFPSRVRVTQTICARTGYTVPVVEYALDRLFGGLQARELETAIVEELGSLDVIDGFAPRGGRLVRAYPIGKVVIVSSQTTIGVALLPAVYALCARCSVTVKDREDALIAAFFETLHEELTALRALAHARHWSGGDPEADRELRLADAVVAFGRDESLAAIRTGLRPGARFLGYGHRASIGYVDRSSLADESTARDVAAAAARDLVLYDGEGCMSLHGLFVERGATIAPEAFAQMLIEAAALAGVEFPAGRLDPRVAAYCAGATFRATQGRGRVFRTPTADTTIVLDPPLGEPPPMLPRILPIHSVDAPSECDEYVRSHGLALEAVALARRNDELVSLAADLGAVRIARFGEMQAPAAGLHHGGRSRIADFVRWVDADANLSS